LFNAKTKLRKPKRAELTSVQHLIAVEWFGKDPTKHQTWIKDPAHLYLRLKLVATRDNLLVANIMTTTQCPGKKIVNFFPTPQP